jgi:hypothetical protein
VSDQVKIGGDSKELIQALDTAEQRFARFDAAVNRSGANLQSKWSKMMSENARMSARIGAQATQLAQQLSKMPAPSLPSARINQIFTGGQNGSGNSHSGNPTRRIGDLINLATGTSGNVMRLGGLGAAGIGLGPAAGILATVAAVTKLHAIYRETTEAVRDYNRESSHRPVGTVVDLGQSAILEQLERDRVLAKTSRKKLGSLDGDSSWWDRITAPTRRAMNIGGAEDIKARAARRRSELEGALVSGGADDVERTREEAFGSSRKAALMKLEEDTTAKIAAIELNRNISKKTQMDLIDQAIEREDIERKTIRATYDMQERQYALSQKLSQLQIAGGDDTAVESAAAKHAAALDDLNTVTRGGNDEGRKAAQAKIDAAHLELTLALRARDIAREQYQLAMATASTKMLVSKASLNATPEGRQRLALQGEDQQAQAALSAAQKKFDLEEKENRLTDSTRAGLADANAAAQSAANALAIFDKDRAFAHNQELAAAKATTLEMELQASGRDEEAKKIAIIASYQAQIAQAMRERNTELAGQLQTQQQLALVSQRAKDFAELRRDPVGVFNRKLAARRQREDLEANENGGKHFDMSGNPISNPAYKRHPDAYGGPDDPSSRYGHPFRSQLNDRTSSIKSGQEESQLGKFRVSDEDFDNQFKPGGQSSALRDHAEIIRGAMADGATAAGKGSSDSSLVGAVQTLVSTLNNVGGKIGVI